MSTIYQPESMESFFNERLAGYEAHMKESYIYDAAKAHLADQFDSSQDPITILDLGCGTGLEIEYILKKTPNAQFICIDLNGSMIDLLKIKYQKVLNQIETIKASYFDYDMGTNRFDYVVASMTMHHWLYAPKVSFYHRIFDALKPGGKFVNDDYLVHEDKEAEILANYLQLKASGVIKEGEFYHIDIPFSINTERRVFAEAGFLNVKVVYEYYSEKGNGSLLVGYK
ncbi:MAG TPA: class I SAM-dependent methyltransferase [Bacillota bacterium]|nr:class I SAM-dependent methyltransferase [Bacillota bacterium]